MNETEVRYRVYYNENGMRWYTDPMFDYYEAVHLMGEYQENKLFSNVVLVKETITREVIAGEVV